MIQCRSPHYNNAEGKFPRLLVELGLFCRPCQADAQNSLVPELSYEHLPEEASFSERRQGFCQEYSTMQGRE
jgi:hypothetical protein